MAAPWYTDIWSIVILDVSMRVCLNEIIYMHMVNFEESRLSFKQSVGLQSVEGKLTSLELEGIQSADCLWASPAALILPSSRRTVDKTCHYFLSLQLAELSLSLPSDFGLTRARQSSPEPSL